MLSALPIAATLLSLAAAAPAPPRAAVPGAARRLPRAGASRSALASRPHPRQKPRAIRSWRGAPPDPSGSHDHRRGPAADRLTRAASLASGSSQWRQVAGVWPLTSGVKGETVELGLDGGSGSRELTLAYAPPPPVTRPEPVSEVEAGLW
jgi:hypothetical protein